MQTELENIAQWHFLLKPASSEVVTRGGGGCRLGVLLLPPSLAPTRETYPNKIVYLYTDLRRSIFT